MEKLEKQKENSKMRKEGTAKENEEDFLNFESKYFLWKLFFFAKWDRSRPVWIWLKVGISLFLPFKIVFIMGFY